MSLLARPSLWLLAVPLAALPVLSTACGSDFQVSANDASLLADPAFIDFGTLPVGAAGTTKITVSASDGEVQIQAMELLNVDGSFLDVDNSNLPTIPRNGSAEITLSYQPLAAGFHWGELKILTDAEGSPEVIVQVRGQALDNLVRAWPELIDFGPVQPGETATATVTLLNEGLTDLTVSSAASDQAVFAATTTLPLALEAGQQVEVEVAFSPTDGNAARGELELGFAEFAGLSPISLRGNDCSTAAGDLYDVDGDGFGYCGGDCDDWDPDANPAGTEECNGADDDCDGTVDEDTACSDDDGDGFSETDGDCNDGDPAVGQHAEEIFGNGVDDDCDGVVDDGTVDGDGDGYAIDGGDCDDTDPSVHPGASETPDRADEDCDGIIDEGTIFFDDDGDGWTDLDGDCNDDDDDVHPSATETANWIDDDCDGLVDEGTDYGDDDGDGFSEYGGDCDDADAARNPGNPEVEGDGIDNDCDGVVE